MPDFKTLMYPVTYITDNEHKSIMGDRNNMFLLPLDMNVLMNSEFSLKDTLDMDMTSYLYMNVSEAIMSIGYEFANDVYAKDTDVNYFIIKQFEDLINDKFDDIIMLDLDEDNGIDDMIFVNSCIEINKIIIRTTNKILRDCSEAEKELYTTYLSQDITGEPNFNELIMSGGNREYVTISSILRYIIEPILVEYRKNLSMICTNFVYGMETLQSDSTSIKGYEQYLKSSRYKIESGEEGEN